MRLVFEIEMQRHERLCLLEAFNPYHLLPEKHHEEMQRIHNGLSSDKKISRERLSVLSFSLDQLRPALERESKAEADPRWVSSNLQALESGGGVPLILDPQGAVAVIRETRTLQMKKVDEARVLIRQMYQLFQAAEDLNPKGEDPDE